MRASNERHRRMLRAIWFQVKPDPPVIPLAVQAQRFLAIQKQPSNQQLAKDAFPDCEVFHGHDL